MSLSRPYLHLNSSPSIMRTNAVMRNRGVNTAVVADSEFIGVSEDSAPFSFDLDVCVHTPNRDALL